MRDNELLELIISRLTNGKSITMTLDYSCLDKKQQPDMDPIWDWNRTGMIELKGTEELVREFDKAGPDIREKLEEQYLKLGKLKPSPGKPGAVLGLFMLGEAALGDLGVPPTMRDGKDVRHYFSEFSRLMFPEGFRRENDFHDVMHISIHYLFARDIFLTRNTRHFPADRLQQQFEGLTVLTPDKFVTLFSCAVSTIKGQD